MAFGNKLHFLQVNANIRLTHNEEVDNWQKSNCIINNLLKTLEQFLKILLYINL